MSGPFDEHDDPKAEFWYKLRSAVAVILSLAVLVGGCLLTTTSEMARKTS